MRAALTTPNAVGLSRPVTDGSPLSGVKPSSNQKNFELGFWRLFGTEGDAGEEYLHLWNALVRFFKNFPNPEELADEVLDRTIHKAAQMEIENKSHYAMSIARYVRLEALKKTQVLTSFEATHIERRDEDVDTLEREIHLQILDECLEELPWIDRDLLLKYYEQENSADKIKRRRKLAVALGLTVNSLRVRVHRIRKVLANKMKRKMARYEEPRGLRGNVSKERHLSLKRRV